MPILLIEDDTNLASSLSLALTSNNFSVATATDGKIGYQLALANHYDLIILDCNLPSLSGQEIIKKLRGAGRTTPILVLTVLGEINNKVYLLNLGADDYLTKPFAVSELLARIKSLLRRPFNLAENVLKIGNLELDKIKLIVTKNKVRLNLSSKEFSLLEYLMSNPGRFLSRQEIMDKVWDENGDPFSNTIEVHIMHLRRKIETKKEQLIFTFTNRGYKIDEPQKK